MVDLLVKLYNVEYPYEVLESLKEEGIIIRRPIGPEKHAVLRWVKENFSDAWASECDVSFSNSPPTCFIAVKDREIKGFACTDATCKGFFGPTGVQVDMRGKNIGRALLLASLEDMKNRGYAYAIIGSTSSTEYYAKCCNAQIIEDSSPGIYRGMIRTTP
ncbi:GNAT family N-acetyltransferase [Alloiococcus sp. CFN-8]|uniref:GNAT family N-acetyltransferase n=1 Tax=Alloiococcus sp. CFN-8 TaxID=3416081 RepID=UPI003CE810F0